MSKSPASDCSEPNHNDWHGQYAKLALNDAVVGRVQRFINDKELSEVEGLKMLAVLLCEDRERQLEKIMELDRLRPRIISTNGIKKRFDVPDEFIKPEPDFGV